MKIMRGSCHCGAIVYEIKGKHFAADYCHCRSCQKITGAPISAWMDFKVEQIKWLDELPKEYASSEFIRRGFCDNCGSTLTYRHINHPEYITLSITSLENPDLAHPNYHIYTESSVTWLDINDDYPRFLQGKK